MPRPHVLLRASSNRLQIPIAAGIKSPLKEGELRCYKCGQKGHIKSQCPKLKGKQRVAGVQIDDVVNEDNPMDTVAHCVEHLMMLMKKLIFF